MKNEMKLQKSNLLKLEREISAFEKEVLGDVLFADFPTLEAVLNTFAFSGAKSALPGTVETAPFTFFSGCSGYKYSIAGTAVWGRVEIAVLLSGGFAFHRVFHDGNALKESWDLYSESGQHLGSQTNAPAPVYTSTVPMEAGCPLINHLYNYLSHEYEQAKRGGARGRQAHTIENLLRKVAATGKLSISAGYKDPAIAAMNKRVLDEELDPVLNWEERQVVFNSIFTDRDKLIRTKKRVHRLGFWKFRLPIFLADLKNYFRRLASRPVDNINGITYKWTVGRLIWFFHTARNNIGLSIAMAIYGPFTFYFITQPLNPHAMWAVGKVRSHYIDTVNQLETTLAGVGAASLVTDPSHSAAKPAETAPAPATPDNSPAPAPVVTPKDVHPASASNVIYNLLKAIPAKGALLMSTDTPALDTQDWTSRMSNFKAMQIGYEENLVFAARMGRLEQMETQLNFPLIVDSAWQEIERYQEQINAIRYNMGTHLTKELQEYFQKEEARSYTVMLYIWERTMRFVLDHPYIMMDDAKEQTQRDYYVGRAFISLQEMTQKLARLNPSLKKPAEFRKIEKLAAEFKRVRKDGDSMLERLNANSPLFRQKNRFNGEELRSYMSRHWEVLFLLQNKAQEASNFGLQLYTWSVRNAIWIMQSLYSAKNRELALAFDRHGRLKKDVTEEVRRDIEPLYESLFHMLNLEYVSIRPELGGRLGNDIDSKQRETIIGVLEDSLRDREKYLKGIVN